MTNTAPQDLPVCRDPHFSHGTVHIVELSPTKRFYHQFMGIPFVRHAERTGSVTALGDAYVVNVGERGKVMVPESIDYRWILDVQSEAEVERAHGLAERHKDDYGIMEVGELQQDGAVRFFYLQDLNTNWWQIQFDSDEPDPAKRHDAIFAKGDLV